jgi:hypothetical protein
MAITPPTTDIEIISNAAVLCGKQSFNTIDAGGAFAYAADRLYNSLVTAELGSNRWRFAQTFQAITSLTTLTPSFDIWLYYWELPSDCLMLTRLDPMVKYQVFGDRVLTASNNTTNLNAVYCAAVPVSKWPPAFALYITYELAYLLSMSVTNSDRMVGRIASGRDIWHSRALFADSQSTQTKSLRSQPYISARYNTYAGRNGRG